MLPLDLCCKRIVSVSSIKYIPLELIKVENAGARGKSAHDQWYAAAEKFPLDKQVAVAFFESAETDTASAAHASNEYAHTFTGKKCAYRLSKRQVPRHLYFDQKLAQEAGD